MGQQITFAEVPEQLIATLLNMRGTIAWSKDKICGLHFATPLPLTEEGLIAIVTSIENTTSPGLNLADEQDAVATDFTKTEKF